MNFRWDLPTNWETRLLQAHIWRVELVCMKVQIAILQNYPWNTIKSRSLQCINVDCDLFINLGAAGVLQSLRLNLEEKAGKEISEPSRLEFLEKFSANTFALSDTEGKTSVPLNRRGIADLALLGALLTIGQKPCLPSIWKVIESLVLLT